MDNTAITHLAMWIVGRARQYALKNKQPKGCRLYMVCNVDVNLPLNDIESWPIFWHDPKTAWLHFVTNYPDTRHLVEFDLSKRNPHAALKEVHNATP